MRGNDKKERRQQKIKDEKPKREKKKEEDKQFDEDLKLLTKLRQESDDMKKVVEIMERKIQEKEQIVVLTEHLKNLQKALVNIKMLETVLEQRNIIQREINQDEEPQGFGFAVVTVRVRLGFGEEFEFLDDIRDDSDETESQPQINGPNRGQNNNVYEEGSTLIEARRYDNHDYSQDQENSSNSSDQGRNF